jgi:hypothetical protein
MWKEQAGSFEDPPVGLHVARCIGIIDLGTQKGEYQGKPNIKRECVVRWELPSTTMGDGRPFVVLKFYTASLGEKANLRKDLVNWRGKEFTAEELMGFDEKNLLDKPCMLTLTKKGERVRVTGISQKPREVTLPDRVNELEYFSLEPERFDRKTFEQLSDYFKGKILLSPEWAELNGKAPPPQHTGTDDFEDDIPF